MTLDDLRGVLDWAADEGWNPGLDDAEAFLAADPEGFFLAEADAGPVAAISVVNHSDDFAFLGLYLCRPEYRGRGIGYALWSEALEHAGDRTVGLDGVQAQQSNYAKSGFSHAGGTSRYAGTVAPLSHAGVRHATGHDIPGLVERESHASGAAKPAYMAEWFRNTPNRCTLVLDSGGMQGLATVRKCRVGLKIGPLVAETEDAARALISASAATFGGPVIIDVPDTSAALASICRSLGMSVIFQTARMYRGHPRTPGSGLYGVASLELG